MSIEFNITANDKFFLGEDKVIRLPVTDAAGIPVDVGGWPLSYIVRKTDRSDDILVQKSTGAGITVVGIYNVDPNVNTQRVEIIFDDADTEELRAITYRHSLKRTDAGSEGVLFHGNLVLLQSTTR